jgi:hypothetical protein
MVLAHHHQIIIIIGHWMESDLGDLGSGRTARQSRSPPCRRTVVQERYFLAS